LLYLNVEDMSVSHSKDSSQIFAHDLIDRH
jgi:hypothetical protein